MSLSSIVLKEFFPSSTLKLKLKYNFKKKGCSQIWRIYYSSCGRFIATGNYEKGYYEGEENITVKIWNARNGSLVKKYECNSMPNCICWSPCSKFIAYDEKSTVIIANIKVSAFANIFAGGSARVFLDRELAYGSPNFDDICYSTDGRFVAVGGYCYRKNIEIWNVENGSLDKKIKISSDFIQNICWHKCLKKRSFVKS